MNFRRPFLTSFAAAAYVVFSFSGYAADLSVSKEITEKSNAVMLAQDLMFKELGKNFKEASENKSRISINLAKKEEKLQKEDNIDMYKLNVINALPKAFVDVSNYSQALMDNRYLELNRVKLPADKEQYVIDSTLSTGNIETQILSIFMRYFCDPDARGGDMANLAIQRNNVTSGSGTVSYKLGCGKVTSEQTSGGAPKTETRETLLGNADGKSEEAKQIIGLPLQPSKLFFDAGTFPVTPPTGQTNVAGTNPMAFIYEGAFAQSMQFLIGVAPSGGNSIATQAEIARKNLATYPFAVLFAERMGTMGPDAVQSLANLLGRAYDIGAEDPALYANIKNIQARGNVSVAEFMDIMMYQYPTSPGYLNYINNESNIYKLHRETVWLTAMQTALAYQRNRWLEILAALEAAR